jgi:hypothetical protein
MSTAHGFAANVMQRQSAALQADFEKQVVDFWTGAWMRSPEKAK